MPQLTKERPQGDPAPSVWLEAPPEVLRARVAARVNDASDADVAVLEKVVEVMSIQCLGLVLAPQSADLIPSHEIRLLRHPLLLRWRRRW